MTTIAQMIVERLNRDDAFDFGLCNRDAKLVDDNTVTFTYPAPVISGACVGTLTVAADGSIFDDTMDNVHASFDAFAADLESMMRE